MIYTNDFAFIHIPKTSGMSIKKSIELNCADAKYMPENMFSKEFEGIDWRQVMHYPYRYWEPLIQNKWVFSLVRNPFIRAVSWYVFLQTLYDRKEDYKDLKFEDLYNPNSAARFSSVRTQTDYLTGSNDKLIDNIFKYEDGYELLENRLGFKINERLNISPSYNYLDFYNEKREKLILNVFEKDFENFKYSTSVG